MMRSIEKNKRQNEMNQKEYTDLQSLMTTIVGRLSNYMAERAKVEVKPNGKTESRKVVGGACDGSYFVYKSGISNALREPKIALERVQNIYSLKTKIGDLSDILSKSRGGKKESEDSEQKGKKNKQASKKEELSIAEVCHKLSEYMLIAKKQNAEISVKGGVVQNYEPESGSTWEHYSTMFASLFSPSYRRPASDLCITECEKLVKNFLESNQPAKAQKNS
jgi:hypothetical protein